MKIRFFTFVISSISMISVFSWGAGTTSTTDTTSSTTSTTTSTTSTSSSPSSVLPEGVTILPDASFTRILNSTNTTLCGEVSDKPSCAEGWSPCASIDQTTVKICPFSFYHSSAGINTLAAEVQTSHIYDTWHLSPVPKDTYSLQIKYFTGSYLSETVTVKIADITSPELVNQVFKVYPGSIPVNAALNVYKGLNPNSTRFSSINYHGKDYLIYKPASGVMIFYLTRDPLTRSPVSIAFFVKSDSDVTVLSGLGLAEPYLNLYESQYPR